MEAEMTDLNPSHWEHQKDAQRQRVQNKVLRLAQTDFSQRRPTPTWTAAAQSSMCLRATTGSAR